MGHVGGRVGVAHDAVREIVDAIEPTVVQHAERVGIAGANAFDEGCVVGAAPRGVLAIGDLGGLGFVCHPSVLTPISGARLREAWPELFLSQIA